MTSVPDNMFQKMYQLLPSFFFLEDQIVHFKIAHKAL